MSKATYMFTCLNIKESKITWASSNHYQSAFITEFNTAYLKLFFYVNGSNYLEWLLCLSAYPDLIIKSTANKDLDFGLGMLSNY